MFSHEVFENRTPGVPIKVVNVFLEAATTLGNPYSRGFPGYTVESFSGTMIVRGVVMEHLWMSIARTPRRGSSGAGMTIS